MAVTFVDADQTYTAGTSLSMSVPAGTAVGDHVIAFVGISRGVSGAIITGGTGFSTEGSITGADKGVALACFYKRMAAAGDIASYTFTTDKGNRFTLGMIAVRGASVADPLPVSGTWSGASASPTANAPSVSPTVDGSLLVCSYLACATDEDWTQAAGMTERIDYPYSAVSGDPYSQLSVATKAVNAGATGVQTATLSGSPLEYPVAMSIGISPAVITGAALFFGCNT